MNSEAAALKAARRSSSLFGGAPSLVEGAVFYSGSLDDDEPASE